MIVKKDRRGGTLRFRGGLLYYDALNMAIEIDAFYASEFVQEVWGVTVKKPYLEIGQIVGTHGVRGEVKVRPWCDSPGQFVPIHTLYWDESGQNPVRVRCRAHQSNALVALDGVNTPQEAQALRGRMLYVKREDLPLAPGRYLISDLIGLRVVDADCGAVYGTVSDVSQIGENNLYHVSTSKGEVLIPAVPFFIQKVDIEGETVYIRPIKGMFDDAD